MSVRWRSYPSSAVSVPMLLQKECSSQGARHSTLTMSVCLRRFRYCASTCPDEKTSSSNWIACTSQVGAQKIPVGGASRGGERLPSATSNSNRVSRGGRRYFLGGRIVVG